MAVAPIQTHIVLDDEGQAWIAGANTKVKEVVLDWIAYGYSPEEIHFQYPHLSMAQIHAAFAYYYDHQEEMDAEIARDYEEVKALRARHVNPVTREELLKRLGRA